MRLDDFDYQLPEDLIAQHPLPERSAGRLLCLDTDDGSLADRRFADLPRLLRPGDLAVFNDTRVIPARLLGTKGSGGRIEILVEAVLAARRARVRLRSSKRLRAGATVELDGGVSARCVAYEGEVGVLEFDQPVEAVLARWGRVPLPPYIQRPDGPEDGERYQTVYAAAPGAIAAPTAGLHFDRSTFGALERRGVETGFVTLHVGSGTFQPIRVRDPRRHRMHAEQVSVGRELCAQVAAVRARGGRVVAVGTTTVRALEAAARVSGAETAELAPFTGPTDLYILPGFEFRVVDVLVTNFHLPRSTLLMLVSAFAGRTRTLAAYRHAVEARYRFFSYGDAMLAGRGLELG